MIDKMKTTYWTGENICKWFDKGLISKTHKQLLQFNSKEKPTPDPKTKKRKRKPNNPIEKLAAALNRHFFFLQRRHTDEQQTHEKEMQIKTTMICRLSLVRMALIKKNRNEKCLLVRMWRRNWLVQPLWETVWRMLKQNQYITQYFYSWVFIQRKQDQ